jgi:hypothetical protein
MGSHDNKEEGSCQPPPEEPTQIVKPVAVLRLHGERKGHRGMGPVRGDGVDCQVGEEGLGPFLIQVNNCC